MAALGARKLHHIPALDGLRGVAVAAVVVYHFAPSALPAGFLGVDLFFVLSGYLITTLLCQEHLHTGRVDLKAFWGRRFRRLLPAALLTLATIAVVAGVGGTLTDALRADVLAALGYGANWHQIATEQSYFALFGPPNPTKHFWSLAIEEQFYVVWPVVAWGGLALLAHRRHARALALGALTAGIAASAWWLAVQHDPTGDSSRAYFGTDTRAFELLVGAFLAVATVGRARGADARVGPSRRPEWVTPALGTAAALACAVAMVLGDDRSAIYYRGGALAWSVGAALVILAVLHAGEGRTPLTTVLGWRPLRVLGLVSYGVYLVHWPVFVWVNESSTGALGWRLFALRVAVTLAIAAASYRLLELPIRRGRVLAPGRRARVGAPAAIGLLAALVLVLPVLPGFAGSDSGSGDEAAASVRDAPNSAIVMGAGPVPAPDAGGPPRLQVARAAVLRPAGSTGGADGEVAAAAAGPSSTTETSVPPATTQAPPAPRPDDGWTPPPPGPALPRREAQLQADKSLLSACDFKQQPPLAEYRSHGTGRLVAVIGDSMTVQMREALLSDRRFDWFVLARCGTGVYSFDHPDPRATPLLPEAFAQLMALRPQALVVALGVTDLGGRLPYEGSMQSLLRATEPIPCRAWVNVYANPNIDPRIPDGEQAFRDYNAALDRSVAGTDVQVLDWARRAGAVEANEHGYHPWLNPTDWVHLLPGAGIEQRAALLTSDLDRCF